MSSSCFVVFLLLTGTNRLALILAVPGSYSNIAQEFQARDPQQLAVGLSPPTTRTQHTPRSRLTAVLFTARALMDGKVVCLHTHTHIRDAAAGLDPEHKVQPTSDKSEESVHMLHNKTGRSVFSRCMSMRLVPRHYRSFPVSASYLLSWKEFSIECSTLMDFCVNTQL